MSLLDALLLDPSAFHVWVANRTDMQRGSGTITDPFHGGLNAQGVSQFDVIMNLPQVSQPYAVIHLGPGNYVTNGYADGVTGGWQIKLGMKLLGSGIDLTKLILANVSPGSPTQFYAIGHPLPTAASGMVDGVEIQDLTIDGNLAGANSNAACGAVRVMGNYARVRRVKVISWGTKNAGLTCYVISVVTSVSSGGGLEAINSGIEDCYAVSPGTTVSSGRVTILNVGGPDDVTPATIEIHAKAPFIRNCYVDCGVTNPSFSNPMYSALSMSLCRGGVVEGNQVYNTDIGGPFQAFRSIRDLCARRRESGGKVAV
ncbi:MAG: hypothetical protein HY299_02925 [Verrucomicrobia bacterium]|nr:hypothetical protein [Verrucomicrobiota bacterium]